MFGVEILLSIGFFVLGWVLGRGYMAYEFVRLNRGFLTQIAMQNKRFSIPILYTECEDNNIYLYYNSNKNFACQEKSLEKLAKKFLEITKQHCAIVCHQNNVYWFVDGDVLTTQETEDES